MSGVDGRGCALYLEIRVRTPSESYRCVFNLQTRPECTSRLPTIIHNKLWSLPPPVEIEEAPALANVEDLGFEQAKVHDASHGAAPATINGAAQLQVLRHTRGAAQPAGALHSPCRTQAVEMKPGEMGRRKERDVERICSVFSSQRAVSGPVQKRCPAPTDMKSPRIRYGGGAVNHGHAKHQYCEKRRQTAPPPHLHAQSISRPVILHYGGVWPFD